MISSLFLVGVLDSKRGYHVSYTDYMGSQTYQHAIVGSTREGFWWQHVGRRRYGLCGTSVHFSNLSFEGFIICWLSHCPPTSLHPHGNTIAGENVKPFFHKREI